MGQRYRVLFVPGSVNSNRERTGSWHRSDVGVGLGRGLPADLVARLDVESSTHEQLLGAAPTGVSLMAPIGRYSTEPGAATECPCCTKRAIYRWSSLLLRRAPNLLRFAERQYVGLIHSDVVRFAGDPELRARVRKRVSEDLDQGTPHVVIGHSLGSVVAIEALAVSEWSPRLLITAGAPLAWPRFAQTWSAEAGRWLSRKSCAWVNLVDLGDQVTGFQVPPRVPYVNAHNVVVGNDHYSTFFGPDGGLSSAHLLRHYLCHSPVRDAFREVCP